MNITTILPVSRLKYLNRVLESLENQTYKSQQLVVIFDGHANELNVVEKKVSELSIESSVILSENFRPAFTISERRTNIVNIHRQFQGIIEQCDWVWSIEDDGVLPHNALQKLVGTAKAFSNAGLVSGVELGRWGTPYVGAWYADDVNDPQFIESLEPPFGATIDVVDATGLYCALVRADLYKQHEFFATNGLGPDVNLGLYSRQQGYNNYVNWGVPVTHLTNLYGEELEIKPTDRVKIVKLKRLYGSTWQLVT